MKPRSKRNRKRPRSQVHQIDENYHHDIQINRLSMNGRPIDDNSNVEKWLRIVKPYPYTFTCYAKARW